MATSQPNVTVCSPAHAMPALQLSADLAFFTRTVQGLGSGERAGWHCISALCLIHVLRNASSGFGRSCGHTQPG